MNFNFKKAALGLSALLLSASSLVNAGEHPVGEPVEKNGMEILAVYLQPVLMEPVMPGMQHTTDMHLEADIHALKGNNNGFGEGEWIPYLNISYTITKKGSDWSTTGSFMPMIASDGPHYADNIKLDGPGKYHLKYHIKPPGFEGFFRHTDKESGVGSWWAPFDLEWDFAFVGVGKKGGY